MSAVQSAQILLLLAARLAALEEAFFSSPLAGFAALQRRCFAASVALFRAAAHAAQRFGHGP